MVSPQAAPWRVVCPEPTGAAGGQSGRVQRKASRAGPYTAIIRRRCRCLDSGEVWIDKGYAFTPNANPFSHLLAKTAKLHRK